MRGLVFLGSVHKLLPLQAQRSMSTKQATVAVGMSGGVDSSVSAALLQEQGYKVVGLHMTNWDEFDETGQCSGADDAQVAEKVCKQLSIPLHHVNFVKEYWLEVFQPTLAKFEVGLTPNPDTLCNKAIKFSLFTRHALEVLQADFVATGHYCRIGQPGNKLMIASDYSKDQSYFLCMIPRNSLAKVLFPIGGYTKPQVRELARERKLISAEREESMGICFVGKREFGSFLNQYIPASPGLFVDIESGTTMGQHPGFSHFTMGQGACIGGQKTKWYVCGKNRETKTIFVCSRHIHPALMSDAVEVAELSWLGDLDALERSPVKCFAMQRNAGPLFGCAIARTSESSWRIIFDNPQRALSPGQTIGLYNDKAECLGGALITRRRHAQGHLFDFEADPGYI